MARVMMKLSPRCPSQQLHQVFLGCDDGFYRLCIALRWSFDYAFLGYPVFDFVFGVRGGLYHLPYSVCHCTHFVYVTTYSYDMLLYLQHRVNASDCFFFFLWGFGRLCKVIRGVRPPPALRCLAACLPAVQLVLGLAWQWRRPWTSLTRHRQLQNGKVWLRSTRQCQLYSDKTRTISKKYLNKFWRTCAALKLTISQICSR